MLKLRPMNFPSLFIFKPALIILFWISSVSAFSQKESALYIGANGKQTTSEQALYQLKIRTKSPKKTTIQTFNLKDLSGEKIITDKYILKNDSTYLIKENSKEFTGTIRRTFVRLPDQSYQFRDVLKGKMIRNGYAKSIVPLLLHGEVTEYYKSGNIKSVSQYSNNELVSNQNWNDNGEKYLDNLFYSVDTNPTFVPGAQIINQRLLSAFKETGIDITSISGSLVIGFVVMENGTIEGVKILKGVGPTINTAAYNTFVNLKGDWTPAKLNNQTVRYFQVFPINFIYKRQSFEFAELRGSTLHWGAY